MQDFETCDTKEEMSKFRIKQYVQRFCDALVRSVSMLTMDKTWVSKAEKKNN